jgi:hypothetical protein
MYFSNFPILLYPYQIGDATKNIAARNILRRVVMSEETKASRGAFVEYHIKDGERPEHIADRVYGNPEDHWIVLLSNDIIDPYHDWYKSSSAMEEYISKKYGGFSVFFTDTSDAFVYNTNLFVGSTLEQNGAFSSITEYHPTLCKLVVDSPSFTTGTATVGLSGGSSIQIKIQRVLPSYTAVNYFRAYGLTATIGPTGENGTDEIPSLDPLAKQTNQYSDYTQLGVVGGGYPVVGIRTTSGTTGSVALWQTYIGGYMGISGDAVNQYAVSNFTYETERNELRRKIKVLHPRYADSVKREIENLLKV